VAAFALIMVGVEQIESIGVPDLTFNATAWNAIPHVDLHNRQWGARFQVSTISESATWHDEAAFGRIDFRHLRLARTGLHT